MASHAALGQKALDAKDYPTAIRQLTEALKSSQSPLWLIQRSTAYQRTNQHEASLIDADAAYHAAQDRGKRELMATAQFRRGVALHGLGRTADARMCFTWARKLNEKEKGLGMWQEMVRKDYERLPEDSPSRSVTVKEQPEKHEALPAAKVEVQQMSGTKDVPSNPSPSETSAASRQTAKDKIRTEWFQSNDKVTITIFAKNVPKNRADVSFEKTTLHVSFPTASESQYDYTLDPLYAEIDSEKSSYAVMSTKIEITLIKASSGSKWKALEGDQSSPMADASPPTQPTTTAASSTNIPDTTKSTPPTVATTNPADSTNHDRIKSPNSSSKPILTPSATTPTGPTAFSKTYDITLPDDEEEDEPDAVNGFFKKLYKGADPDTRRAMMKSFVESNGTSLSTSWSDVGSRTFETQPPDGVEAKNWQQ